MRLLWIRVRSFLSFGAVSQTLQLDRCGLTLITGDNRDDPSLSANGAGKTSLIDALVWCLYGVTSRKKLKGDDVINRFVGKDCEVEIALEDDAGTPYRVLRTRKSKTWKTCFRLWQVKPGTKLDPIRHRSRELTDKKGTQERLEHILKMNLTTFMSTVVFGQSEVYRFSNLLPSQQQAVFDEALGLQQYAEAGRKARERLSSLERLLETLERKINASEKVLRMARSYLKAHKAADARFEVDKKDRISRARGKLESARGELSKAKDMEERIEGRKVKMGGAEEAEQKIRWMVDKTRHLIDVNRDEQQRFKKEAVSLYRKSVTVKTRGSGDCPDCGQAITKQGAFQHAQELDKRGDELDIQRLKLKKELPSLKKLLEQHERSLKDRREDLFQARERLEESKRAQRSVPGLEKDLEDAFKELRREKKAESSYTVMIERERATIREEKAKIERLVKKQSRLQRKAKAYQFWIDAFSATGLRALIVENALPYLNTAAAEITRQLTAGNIEIKFSHQRRLKGGGISDEFHIEVTNKHGASLLDGNSGGERAKIDVCIGLAMQSMIAARAAATCNVVIFDEPFDRMDDVAMDRVATFLTSLTRHDTVILITHKEALKPYFSNILTVVKERNRSRIE